MIQSYVDNGIQIVITAENQYWNEETVLELKDKYNVYYMPNGDDVKPVMIFNKKFVLIGTEDDGHIVFDKQNYFHIHWVPCLIQNLQNAWKDYYVFDEEL